MPLKEYRAKRRFNSTPEPRPTRSGRAKAKMATLPSAKRFVVQKHAASHLHFDFRLEMNGVLKSWAVPKGIPLRAGTKKLAIHVEDHPVAYLNFQGTIPQGEYGGGKVEIWDKGTYRLLEKTPISYKITLAGKKLKGNYVLFKFKDKNWLLFKMKANS